ncbi:Protein of unknown function, partial [Gryllus bimaculatus]
GERDEASPRPWVSPFRACRQTRAASGIGGLVRSFLRRVSSEPRVTRGGDGAVGSVQCLHRHRIDAVAASAAPAQRAPARLQCVPAVTRGSVDCPPGCSAPAGRSSRKCSPGGVRDAGAGAGEGARLSPAGPEAPLAWPRRSSDADPVSRPPAYL